MFGDEWHEQPCPQFVALRCSQNTTVRTAKENLEERQRIQAALLKVALRVGVSDAMGVRSWSHVVPFELCSFCVYIILYNCVIVYK